MDGHNDDWQSLAWCDLYRVLKHPGYIPSSFSSWQVASTHIYVPDCTLRAATSRPASSVKTSVMNSESQGHSSVPLQNERKPAHAQKEISQRRAAMIRLQSDLEATKRDPQPGCSAQPLCLSNMFDWSASIAGPDQSAWEGGIYSLRLTFPYNYPESPPTVSFKSRMFHPNIYDNGRVCMDVISKAWTPAYSVNSVLASVQSLLSDPNVESPANAEAAKLFENDRAEYKKIARRCADMSVFSSVRDVETSPAQDLDQQQLAMPWPDARPPTAGRVGRADRQNTQTTTQEPSEFLHKLT